MTKLEAELKEAYEKSYDWSGHELDSDELIKNMAEVAKKYIAEAYINAYSDGYESSVKPGSKRIEEELEKWLKENGII